MLRDLVKLWGLLLLNLTLPEAGFAQSFEPLLYSPYGEEMQLNFQARYLTAFKTLEEMESSLPEDRSLFASYTIEPTLKYLFGPLTHRSWGGIRKHLRLDVHWANATVGPRGVELPYSYEGIWLLDMEYLNSNTPPIPLPFNTSVVLSDNWKRCTDFSHNTENFYWYYWEPTRTGCDHHEGEHFQNVKLTLSNTSAETQRTFPEYQNLLKVKNGKPTLTMTFAFGYIEEPVQPNPDTDSDLGAREYQKFVKELRQLLPYEKKEVPILRNEYPAFEDRNFTLGHKFNFAIDDTDYEIKVVMNAGVDQMVLFARSYAQEHDSYFGWMGHSRVGSGFDARRFASMLQEEPSLYSISRNYQLIYWGGCNSYSYYTEPFFQLKAAANPQGDPLGTKGLDIMANGLPTYFHLNSANAAIHLKALLQWKTPTSYQKILSQMESVAGRMGGHVLAVVLGDEDNTKPANAPSDEKL